MKSNKTLFNDFIKYLSLHNLASVRLLNILKANFLSSFYDKSDYFVEDVTDNDFLLLRGCGEKALSEYKTLKEKHLQYISQKKIVYVRAEDDEDTTSDYRKIIRCEYKCLLRYDIIDTLDSIYNEKHFVEKAILEKFERDGIKLAEAKQLQFEDIDIEYNSNPK